MSTDETNNDRVFKLLGYAADRGLSATESRELRALLVDDADARDQYAAYMLLHADLAWERKTDAQRETPHVKATQPTSAFTSSLRRFVVPTAWALAAIVLIGAYSAFVYFHNADPTPPHEDVPAKPTIATLIEATGTVLVNNNMTNPGNEYAAGSYTLESGTAQFMLRGNVTVDLSRKADLTVYSKMRTSLTRGSAAFNCPPGTEGFTVVLPGGARVIDLGTAFEINVDDNGDATIRVTEGLVKLITAGDETNPSREIDLAESMSIQVTDRGHTAGAVVTKIKPVSYAYVGKLRPGSAPDQGPSENRLDVSGEELIDGVIGGSDFDMPAWIGVVNPTGRRDLAQPSIVFDLGKQRAFSAIVVTYLVDHPPAIHAPSRAVVSLGDTPESLGASIEDVGFDDTPDGRGARDGDIRTHTIRFAPRTARYVRLDLFNNHEWTFISEVRMEHIESQNSNTPAGSSGDTRPATPVDQPSQGDLP